MKMIRGTLKLALILYICAALSGVYVLSASARITPHDGDDETMLITIEKGDTLWDLCQEHLKDPLRWRELSKYNDFTNPHLIYPGEKLRIPLAMAKDVVEIAQEDLMKQQKELEQLRAELAESEATRAKHEANIRALNESIDKLNAQLSEVQKELEKAQEEDEQLAGLREATEEQLAGLREATEQRLAGLEKRIEEKTEETQKEVEAVKTQLKVTDEHIAATQADVKTLLAQVETNQKAINEVKMMLKNAEGVHEEASTSKRALVFLTTVAAGIGWFAINAFNGGSGE